MTQTREMIPVAGLLATIVAAGYIVVQLNAQDRSDEAIDLRNAATVEVRDGQGQVVLNGTFMPADEEDDDVERKATLRPTSADADAAGEAEVEFAKEMPVEQEVEFAGRNLQAGGQYTLVVDGRDVTSGVADRNGRLELERNVGIPGATR